MNDMSMFGVGNWIGIFSTVLLIICFYFTLTFFQNVKSGDERLMKQAKLAAVICLALALLFPAFYNFYLVNQMMQ